jgi:DNA-damage-inducible protein D
MGTESIFESLKQTNEIGQEFWSARTLFKSLEYLKWDNFLNVLEKAKEACKNSGNAVLDHFPEVGKMIELPKGASRDVRDINLTRYACYLIVQNADPRKEVVALGQTYFALQTRRQELKQDEFNSLESENDKRIFLRNEVIEHNKKLANAARDAGVITPLDYAKFQNYGYRGLYNGMDAKDIHANKGLKKSEQILDHMGSTELAANLFRATQTEEKLKRDKVKGKAEANKVHFEVGKKVRKTIQELGGTMPEKLPVAESIKKIEQDKQKKLK